MMGLYVPPGTDPAMADALERFADSLDGVIEAAIEEVLEIVRDNVRAELRAALLQCDVEIDPDERDKILTLVEDTIGHPDDYDLNSFDVPSVGEFLREEIGRGVVGGAMVLDDRLMAIADNGVHKHRQIRPKQPKRYDTKILPGRW